jgi:predicted secreted protein
MDDPWLLGAIYLTIWWTVLFAVLPLGNITHAEAGVDPQGGDPGAPINPNLKRKFITTTWVSALLFGALLLTIHFHLIDLDRIPWRRG